MKGKNVDEQRGFNLKEVFTFYEKCDKQHLFLRYKM